MTFSLYRLVDGAVSFYSLMILVYVLLSWLPPSGVVFDIRRVLGTLCEPYISLFRRIIPVTGGMDFSPFVAMLVLQYLIGPALRMLVLNLGVL